MTDPITRRELLRRGAAGGAALSLPALIAACGGDGGIEGQNQNQTTEAQQEPQDTTLAKTLTISNWPLYIDVNKGRRPTIEDFEADSGVRVRYIEDINDNDEWFGKFQAQLSNDEPIGRDIAVLTDWMAARMVRLEYVEKKNKDAIPNEENLVEALRSPGWDPNREYSLPWQSGLTGIAFDPKAAGGEVTTIEQLFTDPRLKGKVTALTEMPDTMGLVLLANGDDPTNVEQGGFDRGIATLEEAVDSGQIRRFTGNDYAPLLAKGEIAACIAWSGDIVQLQFDNPNLQFVIPDDGGMIWTDNMLIPQGGDVFTASTFMNFVYQPEIAAQIEAWVNYICPVQGAKEVLAQEDPELANNELIFPSQETLAQVKIFDAEAADNQDYKEQFAAVTGT